MFDPVPWFVNEGVHSPEVARLVPYALSQGAEGVVNVPDLRVEQLDQPGTKIRVMPGAGIVLNRATSGDSQSYVFRAPTETEVDIAATGSSGGRHDLIVARVEDPNMPGTGYDSPEDPENGPYVFPRVISAVGKNVTRLQDVPGHEQDSGITLARIDIPADTATIDGDMITDLREVALPREKYDMLTYALVDDDTEKLTSKATHGEVWPNASTNSWGELFIPEWATRIRIILTWNAVFFPPGSTWGRVHVHIGGDSTTSGTIIDTQGIRFDGPNSSGNTRMAIIATDDKPIPASMRGKSHRVYPMGRIDGGKSSTYPILDWASGMTFQAFMLEKAD